MKNTPLLLLFVASLSILSCSEDLDDGPHRDYLIATPLTTNLAEFKEEAVEVTEPIPIIESGKIYAYRNYIFVNDVNKGFHILDNRDPTDPKKVAFIKLEGNYDISIKDDRLFADSYGDLVILDISDINNIKTIKRLENAIYQHFWCTVGFDVEWPQADFYDYGDFDASKEAIIGWEVKTESISEAQVAQRFGGGLINFDIALSSNAAESGAVPTTTTGQGGSLARFKIVDDYLYAVEWASISVFDISDLDNPKTLDDVYTNGIVETIFNQGDILFIGGTQGMYIYDISSPATPKFVGEFVHGTACDPVVVDDDIAYVTLRSGNNCGNTVSGLYVVDVSNLAKPELKVIYPMVEPYGLGLKGNKLFICDGPDGLKVYDRTNAEGLVLLNHFKDIQTYDVIPLQNSLLMIGNKILYQYEYLEDDINLLSTLNLN